MRLPCHTRPGTPSTPCTAPALPTDSSPYSRALRRRASLAARLTYGKRLSVERLRDYRHACAEVDAMRAQPQPVSV